MEGAGAPAGSAAGDGAHLAITWPNPGARGVVFLLPLWMSILGLQFDAVPVFVPRAVPRAVSPTVSRRLQMAKDLLLCFQSGCRLLLFLTRCSGQDLQHCVGYKGGEGAPLPCSGLRRQALGFPRCV